MYVCNEYPLIGNGLRLTKLNKKVMLVNFINITFLNFVKSDKALKNIKLFSNTKNGRSSCIINNLLMTIESGFFFQIFLFCESINEALD